MTTQQKYGIYIPSLNTMMYIETTREEFQKFLNLQKEKMENKRASQQPQYDDFDHIVEEVEARPYNQMSLSLKRIIWYFIDFIWSVY